MKRLFIFILILIAWGCVDPYNPPEIRKAAPVLIIDGFINSSGNSKLTLSWSQNIGDVNQPHFETSATVWIEDKTGTKHYLSSDNHGSYSLNSQLLPATHYRLHITTSNGKQYQSDFEPIMQTPLIDSVNWKLTNTGGVAFHVSTHDDFSSVGYYKWTFEETWEYRSAFISSIQLDASNQVVPRTEYINQCWRTLTNTDILVESTTRLQKNQVSQFQLTTFLQNSERARHRYSLLAKQQAITQAAYNYWKQVKQSTEDLGTLFGPLPHQVSGNIKCTSHPNEIAIGYFSISTVSTQRAFVSFLQLPTPPQYITQYSGCEAREITPTMVSSFSGPYLLIEPIYIGFGPMLAGYKYGSYFCVDCRYAGGTTTKPDFW
ncbi:MAG: DUF4249 domain-containing protein [Cyclobacteriaceae bacterium]|nr:DUF4249 domain-containing protein [Cyclobacteriaceae bacterium]